VWSPVIAAAVTMAAGDPPRGRWGVDDVAALEDVVCRVRGAAGIVPSC
jgi:hypothetical protein